MRHLAKGSGVLRELNDLRGPMAGILDHFVQEKKRLERYKAKYGDLSSPETSGDEDAHTVEEVDDDEDKDDETDGSETAGE